MKVPYLTVSYIYATYTEQFFMLGWNIFADLYGIGIGNIISFNEAHVSASFVNSLNVSAYDDAEVYGYGIGNLAVSAGDDAHVSASYIGNISVSADDVHLRGWNISSVSVYGEDVFVNVDGWHPTEVTVFSPHFSVSTGYGADNIKTYGNGIVSSGDGNDAVFAEYGNVVVLGEDGDDFIVGPRYGSADMFGGEGDDTIIARGWEDVVFGNNGNDTLIAVESENSFISGGSGDDWIYLAGGSGAVAFGGDGNDLFEIYSGNPYSSPVKNHPLTLYGGEGEDTFIFHENSGVVRIEDLSGEDSVHLVGLDYVNVYADQNGVSIYGPGVNIYAPGAEELNLHITPSFDYDFIA